MLEYFSACIHKACIFTMEEDSNIECSKALLLPVKKNKPGQPVRSNQRLEIINLFYKMKEINPNIFQKDAAVLSKQTDEIAKQENKMVLRLPPYHCELNPIEMVWSLVKEYVKSNNKTFKLQDIKILLEQSIARVTAEHWKDFIKHTKEKGEKMWEIDYIVDVMIDEIPLSIFNIMDETD